MRKAGRIVPSPDGKRIAYTSDNSKAEIWVMENFLPTGEEENPRRK